jgi:hypothetical protein
LRMKQAPEDKLCLYSGKTDTVRLLDGFAKSR